MFLLENILKKYLFFKNSFLTLIHQTNPKIFKNKYSKKFKNTFSTQKKIN
jgi:hypothetical protein